MYQIDRIEMLKAQISKQKLLVAEGPYHFPSHELAIDGHGRHERQKAKLAELEQQLAAETNKAAAA